MEKKPILDLKNITREFEAGETKIQVLKGINLEIYPGEMVAIVGASGSGKSTLMNILGCLDKPSGGVYKIAGRETNRLKPNDLAELRREYFGFIFQRYHLLSALTAEGNVEVPAIYAGVNKKSRHQRAVQLLTRLGLSDKIQNKPNQLSGGQQQRVSICRALMNGGQIILADEPTGALDTKSGREVITILRELHSQGHSIIIVTHDMNVAKSAERIIEISDGNIISDKKNVPILESVPQDLDIVHNSFSSKNDEFISAKTTKTNNSLKSKIDRFFDAFKMAILAMKAQKLRTFLTMLGIIIGIASVVSVVALGAGSQKAILSSISSMGTSTLEIYPGKGFGDRNAMRNNTLRASDAEALSTQSYVHSATPAISSSGTFIFKNKSLTGTINGVGEQFFSVRGYELVSGQLFDQNSVKNSAQEVVIDVNTAKQIFDDGNPIGEIILIDELPLRVIGIAEQQQAMSNENLTAWTPYSTLMNRKLGQSRVRSITVRVNDNVNLDEAEQAITEFLTRRHGAQDFFVFNSDSIRKAIEETTSTMTLLISMIALISLIVGGIGVMNIMLVSVTERTKEIGVRMAVGARSSDIMLQFLIEAILVCIVGGTLGVLFSFFIGKIFSIFVPSVGFLYSKSSIVFAFACSTLIGLIFGYFPAKRAAKMDPIHALERE